MVKAEVTKFIPAHLKKYQETRKYLHLATNSPLSLSGAPRRWEDAKHPSYRQEIYSQPYGVVGTPEKIASYLRAGGASDQDIATALNSSFRASDYDFVGKRFVNDQLQVFYQQQVKEYKDIQAVLKQKKTVEKEQKELSGDILHYTDLPDIMEYLKGLDKKGSLAPGVLPKKKGVGKQDTFIEKLEKVNEKNRTKLQGTADTYVDVSKGFAPGQMKTWTKKGKQGAMKFVNGLYVSSTDVQKYVDAVSSLGESFRPFITEFLRLNGSQQVQVPQGTQQVVPTGQSFMQQPQPQFGQPTTFQQPNLPPQGNQQSGFILPGQGGNLKAISPGGK